MTDQSAQPDANGNGAAVPGRYRYRIRFAKQGDLRLTGHRDLLRLFERLFRRADLRLAMTEGFHPKPRMTFPAALALGVTGLDEVMEFELATPMTAAALRELLREHAPPGLEMQSVEAMPPGTKRRKSEPSATRCRYPPRGARKSRPTFVD